MKVAGRDCGCDARKEIIFTQGGAGLLEAAIIAIMLAVLILSWKYGHRG